MKEALNHIQNVLVTGGTGTFGRAFIPLLLSRPEVKRVVVYSRGEHAQAAMRQALGDDPRLRWFIGDVRDLDRLKRAMNGVDTVIHAAALKRIEVGAYNPDEMVKTNVIGTMNVVEACGYARVARAVALSSDKAYQPISPYGQSKALAEGLFCASNGLFGITPKFAAVRYGNIFNAQGSIVPKWRDLIANGYQEVVVTNPDCTRFFMTVEEAADLVWRTAQTMQGGELVIPKWLPAYRVGDLAEAMGVPYKVAGLPSWEKLHESMDYDCCSVDARRMSVDELRSKL